MATLKKIQRNPQLSTFQQVAPGAGLGSIFAGLADGMSAMAEYLTPGAMEEMAQRGADAVYGDGTSQGAGASAGYAPSPEYAYPSVEGGYSTKQAPMAPPREPGVPDATGERAQIDRKWTLNDPGATPEPQARQDMEMYPVVDGEVVTDQPAPQQAGWRSNIEFAPRTGTARTQRPRPEAAQIFDLAVHDTFGPNATGIITGGMEPPGKIGNAERRHPWGYAIDGKVRLEDGSMLQINDPKFPVFMQNLRKYGATSAGAGEGYMGPEAFHFDALPRDMYGPGQGPSWGGHSAPAAAMAMNAETPIGFFTAPGDQYKPGEGWGEDGLPLKWAPQYGAAFGGGSVGVTPTGGTVAMSPASYVGGGPLAKRNPTTTISTKGGGAGIPQSLYVTESGGDFTESNNINKGHFGRLQFNPDWINRAIREGVIPQMTPAQFLQNPQAQVALEGWYANDIWGFIEGNGLNQYVGSTIGGVEVTPSGMFAVAHLGGKNGLKRFLESGGSYNPSDAYGTSLLDYLGRHRGAPLVGPDGTPTGTTTISTKSAPTYDPATLDATQLGMIGGVDGADFHQRLDASGRAHTGKGNPGHKDYSQLYREYTFEAKPGYVEVGERGGKKVYAAPDYARNPDGSYLRVSATDALTKAKDEGGLIPTRDEYKSLVGQATKINMHTDDPDDPASAGRYDAAVADAVAAAGGKPVVHAKEFFVSAESATVTEQQAAGTVQARSATTTPEQAAQYMTPAGIGGGGGAGAPSPTGSQGIPDVLGSRYNGPQTLAGQMMMTTSGVKRPPLYSPYSGPILRAYNDAAITAYLSEVSNRAAVDIQALQAQFPNDPAGFAQAASAYVDGLVADAPAMARRHMRQSLNRSVTQATTSIMTAQQTDIRNRANNSSQAMVTRLSDEYAQALAAGDADTAYAVAEELGGVLRARESLPGVAWTREQSENVFIAAQQEADRIQDSNYKAQVKEASKTLDMIYDAAIDGRNTAYDAVLNDPFYQQADPEGWRKASAAKQLQQAMPEFFKLPPAVMMAMAQQMQDTPITEEWQADLADVAMDAATKNQKAWDDDAIKRVFETRPEGMTPMEMPDYVPGKEEAFIEWFKSRATLSEQLMAGGYTDKPVFMTKEETGLFSQILDKNADPALRAVVASMVVGGLGDQANVLFDSLKVDPVTKQAGRYLSAGGDPNVVAKAFQGQALLEQKGMVELPSTADRRSVYGRLVPMIAMSGVGAIEGAGIPKEIVEFAEAIYAADAAGMDPKSSAAQALFEEAIQTALGQTVSTKGEKLGGITPIAGFPTFIPPGMSAEAINEGLEKAFGTDLLNNQSEYWPGSANIGTAMGVEMEATPEQRFGMLDPELWSEIAYVPEEILNAGPVPKMVPMLGGEPLDPGLFLGGHIRFVMVSKTHARMEYVGGVSPMDVVGPNNIPFLIDVEKLIARTQ